MIVMWYANVEDRDRRTPPIDPSLTPITPGDDAMNDRRPTTKEDMERSIQFHREIIEEEEANHRS